MKPQMQRKVAIALALAVSPLLTACGSNSGSSIVTAGAVPGATVVGSTSSSVGGACVPMTAPIAFTVSGAYEQGTSFALGTIPGGSTYGSGTITTGTALSGGTPYVSNGVSGQFELMSGSGAYTTTYPTTYGTTGGTLTGYMYISSLLQQQIADYVQLTGLSGTSGTLFNSYSGYSGYGGYYGGVGSITPTAYSGAYSASSICVSGIAAQGYIYPSVDGVRAEVSLYLNNTQHGYVLEWY